MYNDLPYFALKQECKKKQISAKGTRAELLDRLNGVDVVESIKSEPVEPESVKSTIITQATPEALSRFLPDMVSTPKIDVTKYAPWLTSERLTTLENKIAPIAAGKGSFKFDLNHKGAAYQCEFYGGASGPESTTLIDTDNQIVARAKHYFNARLAVGTNAQVSRV